MDHKEKANILSREVIGAAIEVHKAPGPGGLRVLPLSGIKIMRDLL